MILPVPPSWSAVSELKRATAGMRGTGRGRVGLLLAGMAVCQLAKRVDTNTLYLYTRQAWDWGEEEYSEYSTVLVLSGAVGTSLFLPALSLLARLPDTLLGALGTLRYVHVLSLSP